ncbi:MAG: hypothetical protein ABIF85_01460 [Nanoarchaeota archaeon]|nr:hypothetical protein [Nanoarchaeota archaeon]MBU4299753.1 hypothetical protein [Nanoarchaeota archaeon]MBU4452567.1 hypothetical protein [Nanoarchaeota archaeon]MCG2723532.1 hypothetical protein [archaeon]
MAKTVKTGGYIDGFKEAKRLVSEGRAQLESAKYLESHITDLEFVGLCRRADETQKETQKNASEKISRGLEIYRSLLRHKNIQHFPRVKTAIEYTINEFERHIPSSVQAKCYGALFIGPE